MNEFKVYPAIDLIDGEVVRLAKGQFDQKTVYGKDPVQSAISFVEQGSKYLHMVDLDGAKAGRPVQTDIFRKVAEKTPLKLQVGGGIRELSHVKELLDLGVDRVVIGSLAVQNSDLCKKIFDQFGGQRITLGLDVVLSADGVPMVATHGWQEVSKITAAEILSRYSDHGLEQVLCTDIDRDGMMTGPNFELYSKLTKHFPTVNFLASGGLKSLDQLKELRRGRMGGAIIGKAIYEGSIELSEALQC